MQQLDQQIDKADQMVRFLAENHGARVEAGITAGVSGTGFEQSRPVSAGSSGSGGGSGMVVTSNTPALYEA